MKFPEVLCIEDDMFTSRLLKRYFEERDIIVHQAFDIGSAYHKIVNTAPDAVVLDLELPSGNSMEHLNEMMRLCDCPVIIYTSERSPEVELQGLAFDVDDYVTKERGVSVLYSRLSRLLNKTYKKREKEQRQVRNNEARFAEVFLDRNARHLIFQQRTHKLTKSEAHILYYLMVNHDKVVSRDEISFLVNGYAFDGWTRSLDLLIFRLRKKLARHLNEHLVIETIRGKGYRLTHQNNPE